MIDDSVRIRSEEQKLERGATNRSANTGKKKLREQFLKTAEGLSHRELKAGHAPRRGGGRTLVSRV